LGKMLRTGKEHLEHLRDGRVIFIGDERVKDVTTHPAFRNAAQTIASIYDMKADPANTKTMSFVEDGDRFSMYFLQARTQEDLRKRTLAHKMIADMTHGLFGRSPDHFASSITAMAIDPAPFKVGTRPYASNLVNYYKYVRHNDHYVAYAVLPPQAARDPAFYQRQNLPVPSLEVVGEDADGVIISGMKMLATGAIFADEIWIGNIQPLAPTQSKQAITCAIPCNAPGVALWSRQPIESNAKNEFDSPLSWRFDETDSMVLCDNVKVPWERVFLLDDAVLSREIYIRTPGHCYANHQSNVRFRSKLRLIVGLSSRVAEATGSAQVPAVREILGRLAAFEALLSGMIDGQIEAYEKWPDGFATYNRRYMYAALNWCVETYSQLVDILRELSGGGVLQMPASITVMRDPVLRKLFEHSWQTPHMGAFDRAKLFKLVWDIVGSEFAGRHLQYEKFYVGATFTLRAHNDREAPWADFHRIVDDLLGSYAASFSPPPSEGRSA
jgi:4-hydroxyphenylacetate 3-monooxygenase